MRITSLSKTLLLPIGVSIFGAVGCGSSGSDGERTGIFTTSVMRTPQVYNIVVGAEGIGTDEASGSAWVLVESFQSDVPVFAGLSCEMDDEEIWESSGRVGSNSHPDQPLVNLPFETLIVDFEVPCEFMFQWGEQEGVSTVSWRVSAEIFSPDGDVRLSIEVDPKQQ